MAEEAVDFEVDEDVDEEDDGFGALGVSPASHASVIFAPPEPITFIAFKGPVIASKPVAKTIMSNSNEPCSVWIPVGVMRSMPPRRRSTSSTFSRLSADTMPVSRSDKRKRAGRQSVHVT